MTHVSRDVRSERRAFEKKKFEGHRPRPPKVKRWSHQDDLDALVGKTVKLHLHDQGIGETYTGVLLAADQFALKIQIEGQDFPVVVYKSALSDFRQVG